MDNNKETNINEKENDFDEKKNDVATNLSKDNIVISKKKLLKILAVVGTLILTVLVIKIVNTKKINLDDYVIFTTLGNDGYGELHYEFDYTEMILDNYGVEKNNSLYSNYEYEFENAFLNGFSVDSEVNMLSNGQNVNYSWNNFDKEYWEKILDCKLVLSPGIYVINDLKELETVDAFSGITIEYEGVSGEAFANVNYENAIFPSDYYIVNKTVNLENGDEITISVAKDRLDGISRYRGYKLASNEKVFTVKGLTKIETMDVFDLVEPVYEGISGYGFISFVMKDPKLYDRFGFLTEIPEAPNNFDAICAIHNDEHITLCLGEYIIKELEKTGVKPEYTEKEYIVEGLAPPIESLEQLRQQDIEKMKNEAIQNCYVEEDVSGSVLECIFLMFSKEKEYNHLIFLFSQNNNNEKIYWYYDDFTDVAINSDGELDYFDWCIWLNNNEEYYSSQYNDQIFTVYEDFYQAVIEPVFEEYTVEVKAIDQN